MYIAYILDVVTYSMNNIFQENKKKSKGHELQFQDETVAFIMIQHMITCCLCSKIVT